MNDLISRNKLQQNRSEWLNENCVGREEHNKGWNACNEMWLKTIAEQPTVESPTWIPAEYEIPVDDRYVLLSFHNFSGLLIGRYEEHEDGSGNWYLGDCCEEDTCLANDLFVSAWMPLPEPYKGE